MEFKIYIKVKDSYELRVMTPNGGNNSNYFKSVMLLIDEQLDIIKDEILAFFPKTQRINLSKPRHEDYEIQQKLDKLINIRKTNILTKDELKSLLNITEFIVCDCGKRMFKSPINVAFETFGKSYIITDSKPTKIEYNYNCEGCHRSISQTNYKEKQRWIDLRNELLEKGYNFVPNDYGYYYYTDDKPSNKPPELRNKPTECIERRFEKVVIKGTTFMKIIEVNRDTGKIKHIS